MAAGSGAVMAAASIGVPKSEKPNFNELKDVTPRKEVHRKELRNKDLFKLTERRRKVGP